MLKETEKEFKYLVNADLFQEFLSKCNEEYPFINNNLQVNYYYDTDDNALNKSRITVRIRQDYSEMKLQIKRHIDIKVGLTISEEYSGKIDTLPLVLSLSDISDDVRLKGVLITERKIFSFGKNSIICFDANMYLGVCDYEIEVEVDETDKDKVLMLIEYLGLTQTTIQTKSERFFERLEDMNRG